MDRKDRAKQFLPFDAMKGLYEALRRQEELLEREEKIEPSEEDAAMISATLALLSRGEGVNVTFYCEGYYRTICGTVTTFDEIKRFIVVAGEKVAFDDIVAIERTSFGEKT